MVQESCDTTKLLLLKDVEDIGKWLNVFLA